MFTFLEKVEPHFLSDDHIVQHFSIKALDGTYLARPETLFTALQAVDQGPVSDLASPVLPFLSYIPLSEEGFLEILKRLEKTEDKETKFFYLQLLNNVDTDLLIKYQDSLSKKLFNFKALSEMDKLKQMDEEQLYETLAEITYKLEEEEHYDHNLFQFGKKVIRQLIEKDGIEEREVESVMRENAEEPFYTYHGIFALYMAGELKVKSVVPQLADLLAKDEGDLVHNEASNALVKIQGNEVIASVEKITLKNDAYFYAIDILGKIKTKSAEDALIRLFYKTDNVTVKTLIADALCQQLSTAAIPLVEDLIETGYDKTILDLEEVLYANCIINNVDHPKLNQWKYTVEEAQRNRINTRKHAAFIGVGKVGRNDPCPCGSGKKYKKCCLKSTNR